MKFFKILAAIALCGIAVSTGGLAYQALNNENKTSEKTEEKTNNNDSGNTTNVSAYSNLVVSEQAPEDINSIWIKSDLSVKNVEYTGNSNLNYTNNFNFEKKIDLYNDSNFNNDFSFNQKTYNGSIYSVKYNSSNKDLYVDVYDGKSLNVINIDTVLGSSNRSLYIDTYNNYLYVLNLYNNHFYLYRYDLNSKKLDKFDLYNSDLSIATSYAYNFIVFNDTIYLFSYLGSFDYKGDLSNGTFEKMVDNIIKKINGYPHYFFNVINEDENNIYLICNSDSITFKLYCIDKSSGDISLFNNAYSFDVSIYSDFGINSFTILHDGYYYKYSYSSCTYYENGTSKKNYVICEQIYDSNTFEIFSTINYDIEDFENSNFYLTNYNYRIVNNQIEIELLARYNSNTGYYKLTKGLVKNERNKLLIVDSESNKSNNLNPYIIKFNNLFSYKLYTPKFYITDNEGYSKKVYAYKYNTSTQAWETI